MPNVILLDGEAREEDYVASAAITPGELIEFGGANDVRANSSAADADAIRAFAREQVENAGAGIGTDIPSGDTVTVLYPESGAKVNALLAHGENVAEGAALESDGNGALQAHTSGRIIGYADAALNNTTGAAARLAIIVA